MFPYIIAGAIGFAVAKLFEEDEAPKYADGGSVLLAPNGKPSKLTPEQYKLVRTPAFKKWFGDWENDSENASKVVDENGEPKIMYHSTDSDFNIFQPSWRGVIFFSYTKIGSQNASLFGVSKTIECFLNCRKIRGNKKTGIYFGDVENKKYQDKIKKENFDAIYVKDESKGTIAVFNSNQIKLADGTNTTFDGNNPDIRFNEGGEVSKNVDSKLKELGFVFNNYNYRYGKKINEKDYITAFYDKRNQLYKIRGTHKFITPLGENSIGIQFDFDNEKEFYQKINEYLN